MASKLVTTHELAGARVVGGKKGTKRIGKVRRFVFHPKEKRCVGFIVKRPDLLWMFRRKDLFVSLQGYDFVDGRIVVKQEADATGKAACKALGVDWDACVLWVGLPVVSEGGETLGMVGSVMFDRVTGEIDSVETDAGATANALLGKRTIPGEYVRGFRRGIGAALAETGKEGSETDDVVLGALLVSDEAAEIPVEGGLAEQAGKASAVAADKAHAVVDKAKPVVSEAAQKTGEVVNKGAYATGKQISKTKTMFSDFKQEYDKARGPKPASSRGLSVNDGSTSDIEEAPAADEVATNRTDEESSASTTSAKPAAAKTTKTTAAKPKNMFSAFKEEYDKARHESDDSSR